MNYSVQKLAKLASVSVRTLHYYDEIGLLKPVRLKNGYRQYGENELLRLQQILFFRELDFPLEEIQRIMNSRYFDMSVALHDQRKLLELKKKRLNGLIKTIDKTLTKINLQNNMDDQELYGSFTKDEMDQYAAEAKEVCNPVCDLLAFRKRTERGAQLCVKIKPPPRLWRRPIAWLDCFTRSRATRSRRAPASTKPGTPRSG